MQKDTTKKIVDSLAKAISKEFGADVEVIDLDKIDVALNEKVNADDVVECHEENSCDGDCECCECEYDDYSKVISSEKIKTLLDFFVDIDKAEGFENKYTAAMKFVGAADLVFSTSPSISEFMDFADALFGEEDDE